MFPEGAHGEKIDVKISAVADTGAWRTVLPLSAVPKGTTLVPSATRLVVANGSLLPNSGSLSFSAYVANGPRAVIQALVSPGLQGPPLVGLDDLKALGVISANFPEIGGRSCAVRLVEEDDGNVDDDAAHVDVAYVRAVEEDDDPHCYGVGEDTLAAIKADYADVLVSSLGESAGSIAGAPMHIELDPAKAVKPCQVTTARQVPLHIQPMARKLVQELLEAKAMVRCYEPTVWTSPGYFVLKACGKKARKIVDYRQLNKAVRRPVHPVNSAADLMRKVDPRARWFCKLDAVHGYFQVPLDLESSMLTAFLIAEGKFRYLVAPMGLNSSSDEFCIRTDEAMREFFAWLLKIIDDMLVMGRTLQEVLARLRLVLAKCRATGIKLSLSKLEVGQSLKFAGFVVAAEGVKPDPAKLDSIRRFPTPVSLTELKGFLGLANQLGSFLPDLAHATVNMRTLLKKENAFLWLHHHDEEFAKAKSLLCSSALVKPFDSRLPTELLTDASRLFGLGYALLQREPSGQPRLGAGGSCSLTPAQRNNATVELEASAILWATVKCNHYLRGLSWFTIKTDHKPLVGAFNKPLAAMGNDRSSI
jgi:hypothetical protein